MNERNQRKRDLLQWIVNNFVHENPSINYLINYISENEELLDRIEFSDASRYAPRGLYISYVRNQQNPFIYFKNQLSYTQSEQAFHDLRLNAQRNNTVFYVEFDLPNINEVLYQANLFVENPYRPEDDQTRRLHAYLMKMSGKAALSYYQQQINESLAANKFELTDYYVNKIEALKRAFNDEI